MGKFPKVIQTKRLSLHLATTVPAEDLVGLHIWNNPIATLQDAHAELQHNQNEIGNSGTHTYYFRIKDQGHKVKGQICLDFEPPHTISWGIHNSLDCRRQGYTYEAAQAILTLAHKLGYPKISASTRAPNVASQRLAKKLGFVWDMQSSNFESLNYDYIPTDHPQAELAAS